MSLEILGETEHRPYPLPGRPWRLAQRWNDLLFAHWPVAPEQMRARVPAGLEVDTFEGQAWLGVIPFWMDRVRTRSAGEATFGVPGTTSFSELNLRTYVRSPRTGRRGVFFFALDCSSLLSVLGARTLFHLPYFPAAMHRATGDGEIRYTSRRRLGRGPAGFDASYGPVGGVERSVPGTLAHFLTERYCLFTPFAGRMLRGEIHHRPWPLQPARAEFRQNEMPGAHGFSLPASAPVLHFARQLDVFLWTLVVDRDGVSL